MDYKITKTDHTEIIKWCLKNVNGNWRTKSVNLTFNKVFNGVKALTNLTRDEWKLFNSDEKKIFYQGNELIGIYSFFDVNDAMLFKLTWC